MPTIDQSSDFLFIFEAIQCNPNGDPDQENKPRMDYSTQTNLVTDIRLKRTLRDYLRLQGEFVFVDMENDVKVTVEERLRVYLNDLVKDPSKIDTIFKNTDKVSLRKEFDEILNDCTAKKKDFFEGLKERAEAEKKKKKAAQKAKKSGKSQKGVEEIELTSHEPDESDEAGNQDKTSSLNKFLIERLTQLYFIDIRMFGGTFAVTSFKRPITGAIQVNWGYSLNKVEIMDSSTLVAIMSDGNSTFGKDWRVHYSLPAFYGTINKYAAKTTGLTAEDVELFRTGLWECLPAMPTRTKLNQYPKLYVELVYNDKYNNGRFGDLRNHISITEQATVRNFSHITVDASKLTKLIQENCGEGKPLQRVIVNASEDMKPHIADLLTLTQPPTV